MELDVLQTLAIAEKELAALEQTRQELDRRIAGLRLVIQGLRQMQGVSAPAAVEREGLTESCRTILRSAAQALSAQEVKEQLDALGFDWSSYSNPISAVHTVLKRLMEKGQTVAAEGDGKVRYCWKKVRVVVAHGEDIEDPARFSELIQRIRKEREEAEND